MFFDFKLSDEKSGKFKLSFPISREKSSSIKNGTVITVGPISKIKPLIFFVYARPPGPSNFSSMVVLKPRLCRRIPRDRPPTPDPIISAVLWNSSDFVSFMLNYLIPIEDVQIHSKGLQRMDLSCHL